MRWHRLWRLALAATMGLAGLAAGQGKGKEPPPIAVVNGEALTRAEFDQALKRLPPFPAHYSDTQRKAMQLELLGLLIDDMLLRQFLKKHVPAPEAALVDRRLTELEASLKSKGRTLQDYLDDVGQTEPGLRADLAAVIQWNAYVKKHITEDELRRCVDENRELFEGVIIRASHIFVRVPQGSGAKEAQDATKKLKEVREDILNGLSFGEAAKKHSQDPSAALGGDLGYFPPRRVDKDPFIRAACNLKVGQVSDVVRSDHGCHLIKLTDRKAGQPVKFEEVKEDARLLCAEDLRLEIITQQRKTAKIVVNPP